MRRSRTLAAIAVTSIPFVVSLLPVAATSFGTLFAQTAQTPSSTQTSSSTSAHDTRLRARFTASSAIAVETRSLTPVAPTEAPAGFDNLTNGFEPQDQFDADRAIFDEVEVIADGLGPTYNAQSCRECHQNIVSGGASQVTVLRTGHTQKGQFFESQGGSLIQSRAIDPLVMELVVAVDDIRAFRISPNALGDGYVEAIANDTLLQIRDSQPTGLRGTAVTVPVLEAQGQGRIGRFGWKARHGSLVSFAADAYLNEMGITSPLFPEENTASGNDVSAYDHVPDPEDDGSDVLAFANFIRSTKVPSRGPITADVTAGEQVFKKVGCNTCHVASIVTADPGASINGGALTVSAALGAKTIHPYSDFLLHDVGTGDSIPIQPTADFADTANQIKTAPLWGLRTRNRLMHDGTSLTRTEAILRHAGQAKSMIGAYKQLSPSDRALLDTFLESL
jgi:CxxC motif-containing protein (DUF1111 family)